MERSMIIANGVYFWRGIEVIPNPYMGGDLTRVESLGNKIGDGIRAWIFRIFNQVIIDINTYNTRWPWFTADCNTATSILGAGSSSIRC
jgi:hypothetical protein